MLLLDARAPLRRCAGAEPGRAELALMRAYAYLLTGGAAQALKVRQPPAALRAHSPSAV
jgi:hypothetical protein